ncbi:MAG: hypothetical protein BroJett014_00890 [Planctomycetota bacterium]|nr:hypothetical protein [Planctomycetota bacterium]GIK51116.1 MAG: hypothetical protein BroJett014_00890 [Planctomycetota bacterium]
MLNLKYGQQAVSRGFITPQRLQQVLAKQRQLADQGKKVSVRMILEKSKLLTPDQLDQLDRDLNIKVVKKKTSTIQKAAVQQRQQARPVQSISAENFMGDEALPDVSGTKDANPDATIYSPPPPDMQERIRQEREKAKAAVRQKNDALAGPASRQAPQARPQPAPTRQPEPQFAEPMMEPEMEPEPFADAAPELERMDSSPKLESLAAEYQGIQAPEAEALPTLEAGGFDQFGEAPAQQGFGEIAPQAEGMDQGDHMFSGTSALGAEPEPGANWGEEPAAPSFDDGGAAPLDATMYSPPPPQYQQAEPEVQPQAEGFDSFGEDAAPAAAGFGDEPQGGDLGATLYSPPPAGFSPGRAAPEMAPEPEAEPAMAEPFAESEEPFAQAPEPEAAPEPVAPPAPPARKVPPGKKIAEDFADAGSPPARELDDVPTVKPKGEPVHPLRRGVSSEINALEAAKPAKGTTSRREAPVAAKAQAPEPALDLPSDEEPAAPVKPAKSKAPEAAKSAKVAPAKAAPAAEEPKKKGKSRTLLIFMLLLLIVVAALVVPVVPEAQNAVPQLRELRNHEQGHVLYDKVEQWANWLRGQMGLPPWKTGKGSVKPGITENPEGATPEGTTPEGTTPGDKTPGDAGEKPADAKPDAEGQWKALYKPGAFWITRMNMGMEMWTKTEVISVEGTKARIRTSSKMKAEDDFANPMESDVEFIAPAATADPDPKWKEIAKGDETINGVECTWHEGEYDGARSKTWTAKKTGLAMKIETAQGTMEIIEFKEGQ